MTFVLARKYRPQLFQEVVGQDIFVHMLRSALRQGKVGHGFLLTGIRGVGKTTLARLMAKALTCAHLQPDQEPCGACPSCQALAQDKHLDVMEIDAASHTGIDDIRQILEGCNYRAVMGAYKIFIIDEVHMLSKSAFNALLKTLEEPPAHVKFILATTELHKVPLTVISRCQQLHLKRLAPETLVPYLHRICHQEGFQAEDEALTLLALHSEGGVRDALSFLERAFLMADASMITLAVVQALLGLPARQDIEDLIRHIAQQETQQILEKARSFYYSGLGPQAILGEILASLHEKIVQALDQGPLPDLSQAFGKPISYLDRMWQLARKGWAEIDHTPFPLAHLEMVLLRMAYMGQFPSPEEVLRLLESPSSGPAQASAQLAPAAAPPLPRESVSKAFPNLSASKAPPSFEGLIQIALDKREGMIHTYLTRHVAFIAWHAQALELSWADPHSPCPPSLTLQLEAFLKKWVPQDPPYKIKWATPAQGVSVHAQAQHEEEEKKKQASTHPLLVKAKDLFPDFVIEDLNPL